MRQLQKNLERAKRENEELREELVTTKAMLAQRATQELETTKAMLAQRAHRHHKETEELFQTKAMLVLRFRIFM